jgi:alkylresorcinol/alkylpyrone synthase
MRIVGVASAFPQHYYSQEMLLAALQEYWGDQIENPHVLRRLHRHVGVDGRFLCLPKEEYSKMRTWGEANRHWIRTAKELGEKALTGALADAGLHGKNLGAFFFASVTGISSPSIDALLINRMGLCRSIRRVPIFGLGCVAGANFARGRLCARLSGSDRGRAVGRTLLAHPAA